MNKHQKHTEAWKAANKDRVKAQEKAWYLANKEKKIARVTAHRLAHPEQRVAYKASNRDHLREVDKAWCKAHPDKINAKVAKRRALKLNATPKWLDDDQLKQIERYYTVAKWIQSILKEPIHVDHIIPLRGKDVNGLHVPWNLQLLTKNDNITKGNRIV